MRMASGLAEGRLPHDQHCQYKRKLLTMRGMAIAGILPCKVPGRCQSPSLKTIVHTVWNRIESQRVTHGSFDACI